MHRPNSYFINPRIVAVLEAIDLPSMAADGTTDVFVKSYVKPDKDKLSKRKTRVQTRTLNPK
jgi:hypothetical protein